MSNVRPFEGQYPVVGKDVWIDPSAVVIGDVAIADGASLWPGVVARGDINRIRIGERTNIQDGSVLHVTHDSRFAPGGYATLVGADVTVGHRVILHGCEIGHHCLIGMGATIMDGAVVEPHVMVGAGSLVTSGKALDSGYLYVGAPVRRIRELTRQELDYLDYSAASYVQLGQRHRRSAG